MTNTTNTNGASNCTITIDVTGMGYGYLLQILDMIEEHEEDGDNHSEAETLRDWIEDNAANFLEDARAARDFPAIDFFEGLTEEEDNEEEPEPEAEGTDGPRWYPGYIDTLVKVWQTSPENRNIEHALEANAIDAKAQPENLYRAGVFAGLAEAAAWTIYDSSEADDINAITAAIYRAYGVAW